MAVVAGWEQLDSDEWVRMYWPARCLTDPDDSGAPEASGTLVLTSQRLIFIGPAGVELAAVNLEEFTAVLCKRRGLSRNVLIVEAASGERYAFRTKRIACRLIEARSRMRSLSKK